MNNIGIRIRYFRKRKDWTQEELAKRVELSDSTISLYERGEREVPADVIILICKALDVSPNTLLGFDTAGNKQKMMDEVSHFASTIYEKYMR